MGISYETSRHFLILHPDFEKATYYTHQQLFTGDNLDYCMTTLAALTSVQGKCFVSSHDALRVPVQEILK